LRRALCFCAIASISVGRAALAQQPPPLDKARMKEDMHSYFHGEKWEGPFFFGAGLAAAGAGTVLVTRKDEIARGAAYPLYAVGLVQLIVGAVVFLRTDAQVARLDRQLAAKPLEFKSKELTRIKRVNNEFIALAVIESLLVAGGVTTAAVAATHDCCRTLQGVGLGLAGQGAVMLALDLFAAQRAREYTDSLRRFDVTAPLPRASFSVGPISFGTRF